MRITLSGDLGSGKSSVGRRLAERLGIPHYSAGTLFREIGQISNLDALQTNLAAENNRDIDEAVDQRTRELDRSLDSFIIDSRMAWHFVSKATRVYLSVSPETAARRITADATRSSESYSSQSHALASLERRRASEIRRYKSLYSVDITDPGNYDLFVITDDANVDDIVDLIICFAQQAIDAKYWMPKKRLVPMMKIGALNSASLSAAREISKKFSLPVEVSQNYGFFFDNGDNLFSAFNYSLPLVPYHIKSPALPGKDVLDLAKRTLSPSDLRHWEKSFSISLSFADYLESTAHQV